jgi:hypothetical protein
MGGPIVRTGTTPAFWQNWDNVFGKKPAGKKKVAEAAEAGEAAEQKPAKPAKKKKK